MAYTAIDDPSAHFQVHLYSGTSSTNAQTFGGNSDLQPDLVWLKGRSGTSSHVVVDTSRSGKELNPDNTDADENDAGFDTFNSDGFTVSGVDNHYNNNSYTYVAWCWKANGGTRTTNTESGNNPAGGYQANTTAGFSIVDYVGTGAAGTKTHGLGVAPKFMIIKSRSDAYGWYVMHNGGIGMDATDKLGFDTNALSDDAQYWNDTAPTSTVFSLGDGNGTNKNDSNFIAYVFAPIQGYSKFDSYTGNGNADGPFVYTGFKPAWVMIKNVETGERNWYLWDNERNPFNANGDDNLWPDGNFAENTNDYVFDGLSNGFKIRSTTTNLNTNGESYIYMAFAENPFVTSGGVPCTAR